MSLRLCLALSTMAGLIIAFFNTLISGFWFTLWAAVLLSVLPGLAICLGNVVRKFIMPDVVYGSTGDVIQARLFWAVMPQLIGWFIGLMSAMGILGIQG